MVNLPAPDRPQLLYFPFSGLQEPMFLLNSRLKNFCCVPLRSLRIEREEHIEYLTLSFFAEFLEPSLPVCLGLLDQFTCVGLRYGLPCISICVFSRKLKSSNFPDKSGLHSQLVRRLTA